MLEVKKMANATITLDLNINQVEELAKNLIGKLDIKQKINLAHNLEKETREARWNDLTKKIRARAVKHPISDAEITKICKEVRRELYEKRTKSSR